MGDLLLILVFSIVIWIFGLWISKHFYKENGFLHFMLCAVFSLLTITVLADLFPQAYQLLFYHDSIDVRWYAFGWFGHLFDRPVYSIW